jgi:prepilin-type N-terminal cleavage/methylation domain-containing protein
MKKASESFLDPRFTNHHSLKNRMKISQYRKMKPSYHRAGFSLVEILIVAAIGSAIVLLATNFTGNVNVLNGLVQFGLQSKSDVSQTLQTMVGEIRSAGTAANGAYPIDVAGTSSFSFYADTNKNGSVERVRYFLASSSIWKGIIQATGTPTAQYPTSSETITDVLDNVVVSSSSPLFAYYGATYTGGASSSLAMPVDVSQIRMVGIGFTVAVHTSGTPTSTESYNTIVDIRNLRSN